MTTNDDNNNDYVDEEEPSPEMLAQDIKSITKGIEETNKDNLSQNKKQNRNKYQNLQEQSNSHSIIRTSPTKKMNQTNNTINNSLLRPNPTLNVSKAYTCMPSNSIYENFDIQQLTYSIMKDYNQLRISKDESFIERMKFDIYKRQIKEDRINKLIEQNKLKIDEEERIKAFNRLIEDANRRMEARENLEAMKNKLEIDLYAAPSKKYKEEEWKDIYEERFNNYQKKCDKEIQDKIKEKQEKEKKKEMEELDMCKTKKGTQEQIDKSSKRMYDESIKRRLKMEQKLSKVNYENDPNKYKKNIKNNYNFISDDEEQPNNNNYYNNNYYNRNINNSGKKVNTTEMRGFKKNGKVSVTEYNNKRFEVGGGSNCNPNFKNNNKNVIYVNNNNLTYGNCNNNTYSNNQEKHIEQNINNNINNQNKINDPLEKYMEDEDERTDIPKPTNSNEDEVYNTNENKQLEIAALNRLNNKKKGGNNNQPINPIDPNLFVENSSSAIVDNFFTKNTKFN